MGIIRAVIFITSIMAISMVISIFSSIDVYSAVYIGAIGIVIFGLVVGFVGAIKLYSNIERHGENDNGKAIESLVKDIKKAHKNIIIVGGAANPDVYNAPKVRTAFKKAIKNGVKIQTVFSFSVKDLDKADNMIIELAKKGMVELYIPKRDKVPINHFRVIDGKSVYSEKGHTREDTKRYYERFDNIYNIADRFEKAFNGIVNNSERLFIK